MTKLAIIKKTSNLASAIASDAKAKGGTPISSERLVICLDCSASMKSEIRGSPSKMHAAIQASEGLIERCNFAARVGAVAFSDNIHKVVSTNEPRHLLREALRRFHDYDGGTVFFLALDEARKRITLEGADAALKRIIFLSDGEDYSEGRAALEKVLDDCVRDKVIVDTVAFGEGAGRELLQHIAQKTGGVMKDAKDAGDLVKQFLALEAGVRGLLKG